jgi:predicted TIM-barrel enzyme
MESVCKIEIATTGTVVDICISDTNFLTVIMQTGELVSMVAEEGTFVNKEWDLVKMAIGTGLLKTAFEEHIGRLAETVGIGMKQALNEKGYT